MTSSTAITSLPDAAGTSFKPVHADAVMAGGHPVAWFEIHAENYMIDGGPMRWQLEALAASYPVSCHGVGLSIGSMQPLDRDHLGRLRTLLDWLEPAAFSEHLAWSSHGGTCFNDLLPLPYTRQTLARVVEHINQVQDVLGRRMLLENPSLYIDFDCHEMSETEFISEIIRQTGCGILLDINNVVVSSTNQGWRLSRIWMPCRWRRLAKSTLPVTRLIRMAPAPDCLSTAMIHVSLAGCGISIPG